MMTYKADDATRELFARYLEIVLQAQAAKAGAAFADAPEDPALSLENLAWMCREGARQCGMAPLDKMSRWLGFVQGCLAMRGLVTVGEERDVSRPLFHRAYREAGIPVPPRMERGAGETGTR